MRIKQTVPWSKVILVLRNPVNRLYSQYKMSIRTNHGIRKYSLEDFVFHELKAMTTAPLMVPLDVKEGNNESDPSTPTIADHYDFPRVPSSHAILDPEKWKPKHKAIRLKPDNGPLGRQVLLRRGLYSVQLKWWLKKYTMHEDFMVINYDDLAENIQSVYERVSNFAGIPLPYVEGQDPSEVGIHFDQKVRADERKDDRPMGDEIRNY